MLLMCVRVVCPAQDLQDQMIRDRRMRKRERLRGGWRQREKRCWACSVCDRMETLQARSCSGTAEARATCPILPGNGKRGGLESKNWNYLVLNTSEGWTTSTFLIPNGRQVISNNINGHKHWYFQPSEIFFCGKGNSIWKIQAPTLISLHYHLSSLKRQRLVKKQWPSISQWSVFRRFKKNKNGTRKYLHFQTQVGFFFPLRNLLVAWHSETSLLASLGLSGRWHGSWRQGPGSAGSSQPWLPALGEERSRREQRCKRCCYEPNRWTKGNKFPCPGRGMRRMP